MEEVKRKANAKAKAKKPLSKFWLVFFVYIAVLLVVVGIVLVNVWNTMKKYEAAQPSLVVDKLLSDLKQGDLSKVKGFEDSEFASSDEYMNIFKSKITGKDLEAKVKKSGSDEMVYSILSGDEVVCTATLTGTNERHKMMFLTMYDWSVSKIEPAGISGSESVKITVPSGYKVMVNGSELSDEYISGQPKAMEGMDYVAQYVTVPSTVTYKLSGLLSKPEISVKNTKGEAVDLGEITDYSNIVVSLKEEPVPDNVSTYVLSVAETYSNFFSVDIPGCQNSTACIQPYFPADSYYITLAEQYRTGDMWMYSDHTAPVFSNESVSEYISYSDDCYSVRVSFDKTMTLNTGAVTTEHTDQTFFYVNINGNWVIADIKTN